MNIPHIIHFANHLIENPTESIRTVLHQGEQMNIVLWQIPTGKQLPPHRHPSGQDIWHILQGSATLLDDLHSNRIISAGESIVIDANLIHGVSNHSEQDCVLISIVSTQAGFEAV